MSSVGMESAERATCVSCRGVQVANFFENVGIAICEGYGLTETSPLICVNPFNTHVRRIGTVRPSPTPCRWRRPLEPRSSQRQSFCALLSHVETVSRLQ